MASLGILFHMSSSGCSVENTAAQAALARLVVKPPRVVTFPACSLATAKIHNSCIVTRCDRRKADCTAEGVVVGVDNPFERMRRG